MSHRAPAERSVAGSFEAMSRIYFSSPAPDLRDDLPYALVAVRNAAGKPGEAYLDTVRRTLKEEGLSSSIAALESGLFHVERGDAGTVSPDRFSDEVRDRLGGNLLFLTLGEGGEPVVPAVMGCADLAILLFTGEIPSIKEAYLFIREMSRRRCGIDPLLTAVGDRRDPRLRIAPLRLAGAAHRFLGRKPQIGGGERDMAARLSSMVASVSRRREPGRLAAARRLSEALKG